jgi:hypothetical protein
MSRGKKADQGNPYRRDKEQTQTRPATVQEIMSSRFFTLGVRDARAGRPFRPDYEKWDDSNDQWNYERGRAWALLTPRHVLLKTRHGEISWVALGWFSRNGKYIL